MVRGISLVKSFWAVNIWRAPVQNLLNRSTLNFVHTFLTLLHKTVPAFFLIMSYSFFIVITRRALKTYFAWKQLKLDYSKIIWKEENLGHGFVCLLVGYISVKKNYRKLQFCWCRSSWKRLVLVHLCLKGYSETLNILGSRVLGFTLGLPGLTMQSQVPFPRSHLNIFGSHVPREYFWFPGPGSHFRGPGSHIDILGSQGPTCRLGSGTHFSSMPLLYRGKTYIKL